MKLSEVYKHEFFEGIGIKRCFVCGNEVETGGFWKGYNSNPKNNNDEDASTVVCGGTCQGKALQLVMDSLMDTRKYYTKDIPEGDDELLIRQLRADMIQILEMSLTKKLSNIRMKREIDFSFED